MGASRFELKQNIVRWRRALPAKTATSRCLLGLVLGAALPLAIVVACADDTARVPPVGGGSVAGGSGIADPCATPSEGCECDDEDEVVDCGRVTEEHGDYVTCSMGARTCSDGAWSACVGDRVTVRSTSGSSDLQPQALGAAATCPRDAGVEFDPCDPYCNVTPDRAGGFDAGAGFTNTDAGLTIVATADAGIPCSTLALAPTAATVAAGNTVTVTAFGPPPVTTPAGPVRFNLTYGPVGCNTPAPFATTWTIDQVDSAQITGTNNTNGALTIAVPIAGPIQVTAYALGTSATTTVSVKVNVLEAPTGAADPNEDATATQVTAFGPWNAPTSTATPAEVTWLYPYADTFLPLALPAPVIQYWYTNSGGSGTSGSLQDRAVKVSLRYPVNTQSNPTLAAYSDFNYSIIVRESNGFSQVTGGEAIDTRDPQVVIPQNAWQHFEQTARGQNADILIQRRRSTTLEQESRRRIRFVNGQLKGTVYYSSYSSPQGGNTGAILSIAPGATAPTLAVQPIISGNRRCTVCHSVNLDGSKLITNTTGWSGTATTNMNQSRQYNMTAAGFPAPPALYSFERDTPDPVGPDTGEYEANQEGDRFTFGAPFLDGTLYMTHGGRQTGSTGVGDPNFRAPPDYSILRSVAAPATAISITNWPSNMLAVTPKFSVDGTKLAFGYWGGNPVPCSPTATALTPCAGSPRTLSSLTAGTRIAVMDFSCAAPPCTSTDTGWIVSNARDVTPTVAAGLNATAGTVKVAWPSLTPSGNAVVYQRQYRTSKSRTEDATGVLGGPGWAGWTGWSPSHINSSAGALAEIWMSNIPTNGSTLAIPTRLLALNGLSPTGTPNLPQDIRSVSAIPTPGDQPGSWAGFHRNAGTSFTITQADLCSNTGTATAVYDHRLNYLPAVNPTEVGGFAWVVFTSRRMYGNVAYDDPWDAESTTGCDSGTAPTKKLWVAAIDSTWVPGTDPSHPAFYLPGQELRAGNANGYWVNSPCTGLNGACVSNDDCCLATGASPTRQCRVTSSATVPPTKLCQNISSCSVAGGACATTADCCAGLTCPAAGGVCITVPPPPVTVYTAQTTTREYIASCPRGTQAKWRFFEWQASVPTGTSIGFSVQTKANAAATYQPLMPLALSTATPASGTGAGTWYRGPQTVEQVLAAASPGVASGDYLRVTMAFNPTMSAAPTLLQWRQIFDCVPAE